MTTCQTIPMNRYVPKAIVAGVAGIAVGAAACAGLRGAIPTIMATGSVVAIAAMLGIIPAVVPSLAKSDRFGMAVLAGTMGQTLLAIAAALTLTAVFQLERRPLVLGSFAGVFVVMMLQAVTAATLLNCLPSTAFKATDSTHPTTSSGPSAGAEKTT
jgi:hypothetical protein